MLLAILGALLITVRRMVSRAAARVYGRMGIEINEDGYARNFVVVGIVFVVLGILMAAGVRI